MTHVTSDCIGGRAGPGVWAGGSAWLGVEAGQHGGGLARRAIYEVARAARVVDPLADDAVGVAAEGTAEQVRDLVQRARIAPLARTAEAHE